ncbi:Corticoliberin [Manis pentadactyla]|nr:Corticoliberin [Manis pentadactyla]
MAICSQRLKVGSRAAMRRGLDVVRISDPVLGARSLRLWVQAAEAREQSHPPAPEKCRGRLEKGPVPGARSDCTAPEKQGQMLCPVSWSHHCAGHHPHPCHLYLKVMRPVLHVLCVPCYLGLAHEVNQDPCSPAAPNVVNREATTPCGSKWRSKSGRVVYILLVVENSRLPAACGVDPTFLNCATGPLGCCPPKEGPAGVAVMVVVVVVAVMVVVGVAVVVGWGVVWVGVGVLVFVVVVVAGAVVVVVVFVFVVVVVVAVVMVLVILRKGMVGADSY